VDRSLVIIKPDGVLRGLTGVLLSRLESLGLRITALKMIHMSRALAEEHYAPHRDKPFFNSLVTYITSSPVVVAIFEGDDAVARIRETIGPTNPAVAPPHTIRGEFGVDIERNTIHASDSVETAAREVALFFEPSEIFSYPAQSTGL